MQYLGILLRTNWKIDLRVSIMFITTLFSSVNLVVIFLSLEFIFHSDEVRFIYCLLCLIFYFKCNNHDFRNIRRLGFEGGHIIDPDLV